MTVSEEMSAKSDFNVGEETFSLRHMALRNALYHVARRRWLDGWTRVFNLITILGGTGIAADLFRGSSHMAFIFGGTITFVGALQLVYDFAGRARVHEILQRRYFALMADIECAKDPTEDTCKNWAAEFSRASSDEPPTMRALDTIAYNQASAAMGSKARLQITRWQTATRQVLAHNTGDFNLIAPKVNLLEVK